MNINSIGSTNQLSALSALTNPDTASTDAAASAASTPASSSAVSKPGELMAKLNQLLQQDPAKFKQVTQQISDELKTAASNATGPQAQFLSKLSENFGRAAQSGSLSSLQPGGAQGAAHHHRHGGGHHAGGTGAAGGGIESVLSKALDEVNQALSSNTSAATARS